MYNIFIMLIKKIILTVTLIIPFFSYAFRAPGNGYIATVPGPWYTYWMNGVKAEFSIGFIIFIAILSLIIFLFKKKSGFNFKKYLKGLLKILLILNTIWFIFANINSQIYPRLNDIPHEYVPGVENF